MSEGLFYTGVGSRRAPEDVLELMTRLARAHAARGWVLRSGHAEKSDYAFELGAGGRAEIYKPWKGYNDFLPTYGEEVWCDDEAVAAEALELVLRFHPAPQRLGARSLALHGRNGFQVLGRRLDQPSRFLLCWTPDGAQETTSRLTGGTGQAIRVANAYGVLVHNLQRPDVRRMAERWLASVGSPQ